MLQGPTTRERRLADPALGRTAGPTAGPFAARAAALAAALVVAIGMTIAARPAAADELSEDLLEAVTAHLDVLPGTDGLEDELAVLLERTIEVGAVPDAVLDALTDDDPTTLGPVLDRNLERERAHWAEVGPLWTGARETVGEGDGTCAIDDDSACGLFLRTRLQTEATLRLAEQADCDAACLQRMEQVRDRLERTMRRLEQLPPDEAGDEAGALLREAERARLRLDERIGAGRGQGSGGTGQAAPTTERGGR